MAQLFRLTGAVGADPRVAAWFADGDGPMRRAVAPWFARLRACGDDVRELLHDGRPTACVGDAAFAYVDAFSAHAAIGFFDGAALADPSKLLEGTGKRMRHVKLRWGEPVDERALEALIAAAYQELQALLSG